MIDEVVQARSGADARDPQSARALRVLGCFMVAGIFINLVFSFQFGLGPVGLVSFATTLAISGAAGAAGSLLGFLFGIPRTLQPNTSAHESLDIQNSRNVGEADRRSVEISYHPNTNLEQISDWLTKIIVGVGLIQINEVPAVLRRFATYVAPGLGAATGSRSFSVLILMYFLIAGFLFGYLWTRLYLAGALRTADYANLGRKFELVERKIDELRSKADLDARALTLAQRQLEPNMDEPAIPQGELNEAVAAASVAARATIFRQARKLRRDNWEHHSDKAKMERAIPLFKALINASPVFHRDHAQLGYCLKDKLAPDYVEAKECFSKAIKLRGPWQEHGYVIYELNRALCDILRERDAGLKGASPNEVRDSVIEDLRVASGSDLAAIIQESSIQEWLKRNGVQALDWTPNPPAQADT